MADKRYIKLLEQGVDKWNKWRTKNSDITLNLDGVNLSNQDLAGVDLSHTGLKKADLRRANLRRADLSGANLSGANLEAATLNGADFSFSILKESNLRATSLIGTNFSGALLLRTDFSRALTAYTAFGNTDLSAAVSLDSVSHFGSSIIGVDTIYKSRGNIPDVFLRGCGVPEDFLTYMRSLIVTAIEFYSCFISYSNKDEGFAKRLYADLQSEGVRCWFAPEDLKIGEKFRERIDESIRLYDKLLLVLSDNSVSSRWVEKEVETALEKEEEQEKIVLFPVRLDDSVLEIKTGWAADVRRSRHIGDFSEWKNHDSYKKAFDRLMRDLKAEAGREV